MKKQYIAPDGTEWLLTAGGHWLNASNPKVVITEEELKARCKEISRRNKPWKE